MKKNLSIVFVALLAVSLLLSACGGGAAPAEEAAAPAADTSSEAQAPADAEAPAEAAPAEVGTIPPMDGAVQLTDSTTEASAGEMAKLMQIASFNWEGWELPADTTWDTVYAYYNDKAVAAGWTSDAGSVKDIGDNKVAAFGKADGTRLAIIYLPTAEKVNVLAIAGK